ncbi:MAG: glutathione S-transferase family protein, partial [Pseudomonadota bacterium]|nr:glutathione S-transferase family protein [Pseudomonadota bacterium]
MIKLYGFGNNFGVADASPFVLKVDAYMRMAGIQFENIPGLVNLRKAPKGKLPFIDDNGKIIA